MLARTPVAPSFEQLVQQRNERARQQCLRAAQRVAAGVMPQCEWMGSHRYQIIREAGGMVIECCFDCGSAARAYPVGKTSRHSTPYTGAL